MSAPVNLNKARKVRERDTARKCADANAAKFGRTKVKKSQDSAEADKVSRTLDQAKRDP